MQLVDEKVKENAKDKDISYAVEKAMIYLHQSTSSSDYAKVARWKVINASERMLLARKEKEIERKRSQQGTV